MDSRSPDTASQGPILVIGVGNWYRADDAVGLMVAQRIRALQVPGISVREESGEGTALMEAWKGFDHVIIIDASSSGSPPGSIRCFDARAESIPAVFLHCSSHTFGVSEAVELARILDTLPDTLVVYGVEGESFTFGAELSPVVKRAINGIELTVLAHAGKTLETH